MELQKVVGLMRTVTDDGHCYEKMIKEFIMVIFAKCNV